MRSTTREKPVVHGRQEAVLGRQEAVLGPLAASPVGFSQAAAPRRVYRVGSHSRKRRSAGRFPLLHLQEALLEDPHRIAHVVALRNPTRYVWVRDARATGRDAHTAQTDPNKQILSPGLLPYEKYAQN